MPGAPPSDQLVAALWRRGLTSCAMDFARAALARHDRREPMLAEQLEALRRGAAPPQGVDEDVALDLALVGALVDRFRYHEARCLLRAAPMEPAAERLAGLLDAALAPLPPQADRSYEALLQLIAAGQAASALRALETVRGADAPGWLAERRRSLAALVSGDWRDLLAPVPEVTRDTVLERLRARDIAGALAAARQARALELAARLERLVRATEQESDAVDDEDEVRTAPLSGYPMAMFQLRMGALPAADQSLRKVLAKSPDDEPSRRCLADVIAVRRALGAEVEPLPPRPASVHWLSKNQPGGASAGGWARADEAHPRLGGVDEDEESTTQVLPAASEAELLLKLGKSDQALRLYRLLVARHPGDATYRARMEEIEALVTQAHRPMLAEVTARHDLSALIARSASAGLEGRPTARDLPSLPDDGPTLADEEAD